jgi:hypothetical protein
MLTKFMNSSDAASSMVVGFGSMIETAYNLKGNKIGKRNRSGPSVNPMYSNTDKDGNWRVESFISNEADWFYQSFCSAHLEQPHQWGTDIGVEDKMWVTNEEWNNYAPGGLFVGLSVSIVSWNTLTV